MMRKSATSTPARSVWPPGPVLRRGSRGQPEHVVNYFFFVAEEVRELMARSVIDRFDDDRPQRPARHEEGGSTTEGEGPRLLAHLPPAAVPVGRAPQCETQDHGLDRALDHRS